MAKTDDRAQSADPPSGQLLGDERGSASLEFVTVGVILLVPLVYLVLAVAAIQSAAMAVEGTARHAARMYVQASNDKDGRAAIDRAVTIGLADYGIDSTRATVRVVCTRPECLTAGGRVTVHIEANAALPLVPSLLDLRQMTSIPVGASATQTVSRFADFRQ